MNNKLRLTFILTPLLLAIWLASCVPDARAKWELVSGAEEMGDVYQLASDGIALYAAAEHGFFISLNDGYNWHPTDLNHSVYQMALTDDAVYAYTFTHGVYRSDTRGITWKQINNGLRTERSQRGELLYPRIEHFLPTMSGTIIAVGYHWRTFTSNNRGESWHEVTEDWVYRYTHTDAHYEFAYNIWRMTEFDGYLWAYTSDHVILRSPDNGETWDKLPDSDLPAITQRYPRLDHWVELDDRLYIAAYDAFGRWNEAGLNWDNLSAGLPVDGGNGRPAANRSNGRNIYLILHLAVHRGRIFAGLSGYGVYMFDERSKTWIPAGLDGLTVSSLKSHQSDLYAATKEGIYRASIPTVQPYGKAATTWGRVKQGDQATEQGAR